MQKTNWIIGLSIAGIMVLSGTAFALTADTSPVKTTQNQRLTSPSTMQNTDPNAANSAPGPNGYGSGYGMMGGQGGNGYGSGYGMMGGQGGNGYGSGYGMMGGQGGNGYGSGYGMMGGQGGN